MFEDSQLEKGNLEGIGGWLILVAIGICIGPLMYVTELTKTYTEVFSKGYWKIITTQGGQFYNPFLSKIILAEIFFHSISILLGIYMAFLFFSKKKLFPKVYIGIAVFTLIFIIADGWAVSSLFHSQSGFDSQEITKQITKALFSFFIWVPYMIVSKRVKATFVN